MRLRPDPCDWCLRYEGHEPDCPTTQPGVPELLDHLKALAETGDETARGIVYGRTLYIA